MHSYREDGSLVPAVLSPLQQLSFFSLVLRRGTVNSHDRHTNKKLVPRVINPARTWGLPLRLLLDHSALGQQCEESTGVLSSLTVVGSWGT